MLMKKLIKYLLGIIALGLFLFNGTSYAVTILQPFQGGTGLGSAVSGDIGKVLTVSNNSPFTFSFSTPATGTVTSVSGTTNRITSTGGATPVIDISGSYVGQSSITTLGTISTGTWSGTTIGISKGGTGQTTANSAFNALAPSQTSNSGKYLTTNGTDTSWATVTAGISGSGSAGQNTFWTGASSVSGDNANWWDNTNKRLGIGTTTPDAQGHFALASSDLTPPNWAPGIQGGYTSNYFSGDDITYRIYCSGTFLGSPYYSSTYIEHDQFISNDGDTPSLELSSQCSESGGTGTLILRDINGGGYNDATIYSVSGTFIDDNSQAWADSTTVTPSSISLNTRINYSTGGVAYGLHTDSNAYITKNIYTPAKILIGASAPDDTSAPLSVVDNATASEVRLGFFEQKGISNRGEFTLANSGNGSWTNNFISIMNHGSSYGSNYYTTHDAGSSIFLLQGANAYQMAFATYNSQPINFWIGGTKKMDVTTSGVAISNLTSGRLTFAGASGLLSDDSDLTFATDTLTATKIAATTFTGAVTLSTQNIVTDTTTGTKIGTGTTQKLGFFNATPIVQVANTTEIGTVLSNLGLRASGTAYPITTSGAVTLGSLTSTRVPIAGTAGLLADDADMTFATDTLTVTGLKVGTTKITSYNGINTVSNGVASEIGTADITAQSAAKTATTLCTPGATGMFRISIYEQITTAASSSSILGGATGTVITYNDGDGNVAQSDTVAMDSTTGTVVTTAAGNTTTTNLIGVISIYARTGVAIQYAIGYTSVGVTAMQYAAHLKCEAM